MRRYLVVLVLLALLLGGCSGRDATPTPGTTFSLPAPRPAGSCHINGALPDSACTPGKVQQGVTAAVICAPGYTTKTIRPPSSYTDALKAQQLVEYGMAPDKSAVEEDHLVPLELAGDPAAPENLWPEPRGATPGAGDKDRVENAAHKAVCDGKMTLDDAQKSIASDWVALRARLTNTGLFTLPNPSDPVPTEP